MRALGQEPSSAATSSHRRGIVAAIETTVGRGVGSGDGLTLPPWRPVAVLAVGACAAGAVVLAMPSGSDPDALRVAGVFIAVGASVASLGISRWLVGGCALIAAWWLAVLTARYLPQVINPPPPVNQAVGGGALFGTPYRGVQIAAVLAVAVPALVASALTLIIRLRSPGLESRLRGPVAPPSSPQTKWSSKRSLVLWAAIVLLIFGLIPDLKASLGGSAPIPYSWDTSNGIAWAAFIRSGLTPMKDFFFPYGFRYLYDLQSFGPAFEWLAEAGIVAIAGWSLWMLSGRRTVSVVACLVAMLLLANWGPGQIWRYLPGLLIPVTYAAVGPASHSRLAARHLALFLSCLFAVLIEPDLLLYGVLGAILVVVGEFVSGRLGWSPRRIAVGLAWDAIAVLSPLVILCLIWLATGTASGWLRFFGGFTAISAADAPNEQMLGAGGLLTLHPNAYSLSIAVPALLATAGFLWAFFRRGDDRGVSAILLGAAGVALVMLLKSLVREVPDLVIAVTLIPLAWAVILAWRWNSFVTAAACGAGLAALLTLVNLDPSTQHWGYVHNAVNSPTAAVHSVEVAFDGRERKQAGVAWFNPARFADWPDTAIADDYLATVHGPPVPRFAIIGDSAMTYVLLHEAPPYQVELYDAAPLDEQRKMLSLLEQRDPPFLIWREDIDIDNVPYDVRDPVLFTWMVSNYVPVRSFPSPVVDILRRRKPGEPRATGFWRTHLGAFENLGYIPSYSTAASSPTCKRAPGCVSYALVEGNGTGGALGAGIKVSGNGFTYTLTFNPRPGVSAYPIRLDRLWFSPLLGPNPRLESVTPGFSVKRVALRSGENLY